MNYSIASISELVNRFGSPLYIFDEGGFSENAVQLQKAMTSFYGNYRIAYSFKTNYTPYICAAAKRLGAFAEVVSGMEYSLAKRIGYDDAQIIFNGPDKREEGTEAFLNGCMLQADSLDELRYFCGLASSVPERRFKIGLRCNIDIGQGFISRFGMDEDDLGRAFLLVSEVKNLKIAGLHCHISRCRSKAAWKKRMETMLRLSDRFFRDAPEYLNLGSGMFGSMDSSFAAQFDRVPSYADYAEVTAGLIAEHFRGKAGPVLLTEPGTTLVSRYVDCISRVKAIKRIRAHDVAILDSSMHSLGETCSLKRLPVQILSGGAPQESFESIDLTGYTCLEQDVLLPGYSGKLAVGDLVVFGNVGGYSNVLKPPFIRPNCAMVAAVPTGSYQLIKKAETYDDLLQTYLF